MNHSIPIWVLSIIKKSWKERIDYNLKAHEAQVVPLDNGKFQVQDKSSGDPLGTFYDSGIANSFKNDYERAQLLRKPGDKVWEMYSKFTEDGKNRKLELVPSPSQHERDQLERDILLAPYTFEERLEKFRNLRKKGLPYVPILEKEMREFREKPARPHGVELPAPAGVPDIPTVKDLIEKQRLVAWVKQNCKFIKDGKTL